MSRSLAPRRCSGLCGNCTSRSGKRTAVIRVQCCYTNKLSAATDRICSSAWLVDTRKFSLSRKTPRSRQRSRNPKAMTRRQQRKQHWCSHVVSAGRKCQIPKPSSNILRASTPKTPSPQSWLVWRHEQS